MATLVAPKSKAKGYSVQWYEAGERRTIYLGHVPKAWAAKFHRGVERLLDRVKYQEPLDGQTRAWLASLEPKQRAKLAAKGLVEALAIANLGDLVADGRKRLEERNASADNLRKFDTAARNFFRRHDAAKSLGSIDAGDALAYRDWLLANGRQDGKARTTELAPETAAHQISVLRTLFDVAQTRNLVERNPFADVSVVVGDPDAQVYVPLAVVARVLEHCSPPLARRVALARYAGLRHPSEVDALKLEWVNLPERRMVVFSPKNKRFKHKRYREVPIDPLLVPHLEDAADAAAVGETYVAHESRSNTATAWRNQLERACMRAGVVPWIGLWKSLRGSRAVDLLRMGVHEDTVVKWQNTSRRVLRRSYLRPTADDFALVTGLAAERAEQAEPRTAASVLAKVAAGPA